MQWYYAVNGQQQGPVEQESLFALAREGKLGRDDLVWNATMGDQWAKASSVAGLFEPAATAAPGSPPLPSAWSDAVEFKSQAPNRDLMAQARGALAGAWGLADGGVLVYLVIQIVIAMIPVLGGVISFVVAGPLALGWYRFFITLSRRQPGAVGMLFDGFKRFGTAFVATLLMGLLILAWMLPAFAVMIVMGVLGFRKVLGGGGGPSVWIIVALVPLLIAAWIPSVIAQLRYSMTYFIINDGPDTGAWEAIQRSTRVMKGNTWKFFCLQCRFIGWGLLCLPTLGIGFLWLVPYVMTSMARFYDEMIEEPAAEGGTVNRGP